MINLEDLNPQQRQAAETTEGPVLVLSGAGTGKTRTITYRIANMLKQGIAAENILAVTFTNKAAKEMVERVRGLVGNQVDQMQVSTFHSLGLRIIREHASKMGLKNGFSIYGRTDQVSIVKKALRSLSISWKVYKPDDILAAFSSMRVPEGDGLNPQDHDEIDQYVIEKVWQKYSQALKSANAVDFDSLLILPVRFFREHAAELDEYRKKFKYILVDEYQDTNPIQFEMIFQLAKKHQNLCVVGDDDQSIYGWRGAEIRNILDFELHFPKALVVRLEENYRSSSHILDAANAVISKNIERKAKKLWTQKKSDKLIRCVAAPDDMSEAEMVVSDMISDKSKTARKYCDYAILMRMNTQARQFEEVLRRYKVPYIVVGGMQFFDRKEIKDFISYLRLIVNPNDEEAFLRIINVPPRGVGDIAIDWINQLAAQRDCSLYEALRAIEYDSKLKVNQRTNLSEFFALIESLRAKLKDTLPSEIAAELWEKMDYRREMERILKKPEDVSSRLSNVESFMDGITYYENKSKKPTLTGYLRDISLLNNDDDEEMAKDKLPLMTIHSSKGLEFPSVYVVGTEQGIMPHTKSAISDSGLAEERRLFYVAITRAKQDLTISYAASRMKFGSLEKRHYSDFLNEIPSKLLDWDQDFYTREATEDEATNYLADLKAMLSD